MQNHNCKSSIIVIAVKKMTVLEESLRDNAYLITYSSASFCVSITAAIGIPKFEAGPQKSEALSQCQHPSQYAATIYIKRLFHFSCRLLFLNCARFTLAMLPKPGTTYVLSKSNQVPDEP